jgi:hypothetical protein
MKMYETPQQRERLKFSCESENCSRVMGKTDFKKSSRIEKKKINKWKGRVSSSSIANWVDKALILLREILLISSLVQF